MIVVVVEEGLLRWACGDKGEFECECEVELLDACEDGDVVALVAIDRVFVAAREEADGVMLETVDAWGDDERVEGEFEDEVAL